MKVLKGKIVVLSGLHIGSGNDNIKIGGVDSTVIKDGEGFPYIPGSSLKGKIRALLAQGVDLAEEDESIKSAFGVSASHAGRVLFRDAFLSQEDREKFKTVKREMFEHKCEIQIDRKKGTTKNGSLRTIERVIPGMKFDLEIVVKNDEDLALIERGITLLEGDFLGGMGSRGYGQIKIELEE